MRACKQIFPALLLWGMSILTAHAQTTLTIEQDMKPGTVWTNQTGSVLAIEDVHSDGLIEGYYINRAEGYGCSGTPYPVTGWMTDNVVSFTVLWNNIHEKCHAVTSWSGYYHNGQLMTKWSLVQMNAQRPDQINIGEDLFKHTPAAH